MLSHPSRVSRTIHFFAFLMALCGALCSSIDAQPPNIVLIVADDLGINDLGSYGRAGHETPCLDQVAKEGLRFTTAYCAQPICSASRAALLTGKSPARLHLTSFLPGRADTVSQKLLQPVIEGQLPLEEPTLAEWLKSRGYATGMFGKWHLGGQGFGPREQGFDIAATAPSNSTPTQDEGGKSEFAITAAAEKFIADNRSTPFFCYVAHHSPHIPLTANADIVKRYADAYNPTYAAMIETLDAAIGRLVKQLDDLGLTDKTAVVFTSDNGGLHVLEFPGALSTHNHPYRAGKGFLYEGGLRVPLIVRWPGHTKPDSVSDTPVMLTDLAPTLMAMAGMDLPRTVGPLDGVNLIPVINGSTLPNRSLFWHFPHYTNQGSRPASAIRQGKWKLIEQLEDSSVELFDLAVDAGEQNNLAEREADQAKRLQQDLAAWRMRVGAQMMTDNPRFDATLHEGLSLHDRLYRRQDASLLRVDRPAAAIEAEWKEWRALMNSVVQGKQPKLTPSKGDIRLLAKDAVIHGRNLRYESETFKNVLGYWTLASDWAEWNFDAPDAGTYEIEIQQGCGNGSGGSSVAVIVGDQQLEFKVIETGHFQQMILRTIGTANLVAGKNNLAVKPQSKPGAAVMDLRRIVLRPKSD